MTDNEIIKALECCSMQSYPACCECPYHDRYSNRGCIDKRNADIAALINRQKEEIEKKDGHIMELQAINDSIKGDKAFLGEEITKHHKELLKSKVFKFVRDANRIYNIMDFQDGEILMFYDYPEKPSALSKGYLLFKGKENIRLVNVSEVKELSYAEIKAQAYKEFAERLKEDWSDNDYYWEEADVYKWIDNLLKELVGEDK